MKFKNNWGYFSDTGDSFTITDPATPHPWENYLYSFDGNLQVKITQRGKGLSHFVSPDANKVSYSRNYCIKDFDTGKCFSINAGASPDKPESWRCIHYPGRTVFQAEENGLKISLTIFVDQDSHTELNRLEIENTGSDKKISVIGYHKGRFDGISNHNQMEQTVYLKDIGALLTKRYGIETAPYKYSGFYLADKKADSFCGDNDSIFGFDVPESEAAIWNDAILPNQHASATPLIQALQHNLTIKDGQSVVINYAFGIADNLEESEELAKKFVKADFSDMLQKNISFYNNLINMNRVQTPDEVVNFMTNVWLKTQLHKQVISDRGDATTHNWRNNMLDCWGYLPFNEERSRHYIRLLCILAHEDGHMPRTSPRVPELLSGAYVDFFMKAHYSDISAWAGISSGRYAAETGDLDFFKETVQYADGKKSATIIECLVNGIDWILDKRGKHGLILVLDGDWCDPLNNVGKKGIGETPWTSVALIRAIKAFNPLLEKLGMNDVVQRYTQAMRELSDAVNKYAWDGEWYLRAFTDDGIKFCSKDDGHVSLMMQAWPLIAGIVPEERIPVLLKSIDRYLKTELGALLYGPPFEKPRHDIGRVTSKQPGTGENGSVYVHGNTMLANAEIAAGRADEALKLLKHIFPLRDNSDELTITKEVPLWFPNFWHGPRSDAAGRKNSIISTGAVATLMTNIFDGFMGIKPHIDYLEVSPCMPSSWKNAIFNRKWRGTVYNFSYSQNKKNNGLTLYMDGKKIEGNRLPLPKGEKEINVSVEI